jgi:DNA-binding MarR family transcriptional regulator
MIHALVGYANCVLAVRDGFAALLGVSGVQYEILMVVYRLHGTKPCTVGDVAAYVRRSVSFVTIESNKLAAKGLIDKQPDFADRRRVLLRVTSRCIKRLNDIAPIQRRANDALFENQSAADFRALCRIYEKLAPCGPRAVDLISLLVREHSRDGKVASA